MTSSNKSTPFFLFTQKHDNFLGNFEMYSSHCLVNVCGITITLMFFSTQVTFLHVKLKWPSPYVYFTSNVSFGMMPVAIKDKITYDFPLPALSAMMPISVSRVEYRSSSSKHIRFCYLSNILFNNTRWWIFNWMEISTSTLHVSFVEFSSVRFIYRKWSSILSVVYTYCFFKLI